MVRHHSTSNLIIVQAYQSCNTLTWAKPNSTTSPSKPYKVKNKSTSSNFQLFPTSNHSISPIFPSPMIPWFTSQVPNPNQLFSPIEFPLEKLYLCRTKITDLTVQLLASDNSKSFLRELYLGSTRVTDKCLQYIPGKIFPPIFFCNGHIEFEYLVHISLCSTPVSTKSLKQIQRKNLFENSLKFHRKVASQRSQSQCV